MVTLSIVYGDNYKIVCIVVLLYCEPFVNHFIVTMTLATTPLESLGTARYITLADRIESAIRSGELKIGDKLPTHRKLADQLEVTVGTVTRGYAEAQRRGLINAIVGSGSFVSAGHQPDIQFGQLDPMATMAIDLSLNLPVRNQSAPGIGAIMQQISQDQPCLDGLMQYQQERGSFRHRQKAASWLIEQGVQCEAANVAITCGGQHAIILALMAATRRGDTIGAEGLAYPGLKAAASQLGVKVIGLPMDDEGVLPEAFSSQSKLNHLRAIYICPSIQNPTNASMGVVRRKQIIKVARRDGLWIIEDDVPANFLPQNPQCFVNLAPERTFYINSHSKTVAPGLRVGYLLSPPKMVDSVAASIRAQCWFAPTLNVEIVQRWIDSKEAKDWLSIQKKELDKRHRLALELLGEYDIKSMRGSFHVWLLLPEPWRAIEFQALLEKKGVKVLSAETFAVGRFQAPQAIRVCLSGPSTIQLIEAGLVIIRQQLDDGYDSRLSVF
jgi:DNA-binding transcriptional MocR family regulator